MLKYLLFFIIFQSGFGNPNVDFVECCKRKNIPDGCIKYCTYDIPDFFRKLHRHPKTSAAIASVEDECAKLEVVAPYIQCLQKEKDNRDCCETGGVATEYPYCLDLCDGTRPISGVDIYLKCQMEGIRDRIVKCGKRA
uniref:Uncharacterized protein n=1 Tax=Panagrolaimus sp. PS1159 TaxID=55785 RepID=A0AC35GPP4_9BILA